MEHFVFLVFIADISVMFKKLEIRNGNEVWGDGEYICESFYIQKIVLTSTEKLKNL